MMTKLMLAGVAALALSTGAALAATTQPTTEYGNAQPQYAQSQGYAYTPQQQGTAPSHNAQNNPTPDGSVPVTSEPFTDFPSP